MLPRVTVHGGAGEIGGNKILLEDRDTRVFLDFGTSFSEGVQYFGEGVHPRSVNGAGDLFEFGLLPELPGFYSERALQNTRLRHSEPEIDAIVLSHYHSDHFGRINYVDPAVPVYCGETTRLIDLAAAGASPLKGHELRTFRTGRTFKIGSMEFEPLHVDHSIPGAYGFLVHTTQGTVAYTGDFRFHGPAGGMTEEFVKRAGEARPALLISEGTRVAPEDPKGGMSEKVVLDEASKVVRGNRHLVLSSFRGNDIDRVNTFFRVAERCGRKLVISMKTALLLEKLAGDERLKVPTVGKQVFPYVRRKRTGKMDDSDYFPWERQFLDKGVTAADVHRAQGEYFLHLDMWNFPEIIDIKPESEGAYIHSSSEAFNEEGERDEEVVKNWMNHFGFSYHQIHASGHAPMREVGRLVHGVGARSVVPVHTEHPAMFREFKVSLSVPEKGRPLPVPG